MAILRLFGNRNKNRNDKNIINNIPENTFQADDDDEIIAVITAAIAAILQKPASGFRVVSFKKRGNWKYNI